jgi:hypothetical protein
MQGPQAALARILRESCIGLPQEDRWKVIQISRLFPAVSRPYLYLSDHAAQSADQCLNDPESLSDRAPYEPPTIERRLLKSYGVLSRIEFIEGVHDANRIVTAYDGEKYCDNVVRWMAYKVRLFIYLSLT